MLTNEEIPLILIVWAVCTVVFWENPLYAVVVSVFRQIDHIRRDSEESLRFLLIVKQDLHKQAFPAIIKCDESTKTDGNEHHVWFFKETRW